MKRSIALTALIAALMAPVNARPASEPDLGRPFEPAPVSEPLYGIREPTDANGQRHIVEAADGVELFLETWLPALKDGNVPPSQVPTVVVMTPYATKGVRIYDASFETGPVTHLVPRGYAVSIMHARGTAESGGCFDDVSPKDADDGARVVEYLATQAPWSNGVVGAFGLSQDGGRPLATAALGEASKARHLKAMVLLAPMASRYHTSAFDGIPYMFSAAATQTTQVASNSLMRGAPAHLPERFGCLPEHYLPRVSPDGDVSPYFLEHDLARAVANVRAATLMVHGHRDTDVEPIMQAGLFDAWPDATPKAGVFGVFDHEFPSAHISGLRTEWERLDFMQMVTAWFDRYLKGAGSAVESWPVAQVQGTDGQWRGEPDWPTTGGPVGHLALGSGGQLGVTEPSGSSSYTEGLPFHEESLIQNPGDRVVWTTNPLAERLEMTGQPVLDVWVKLSEPDAHLAAKLETFDAAAQPIEAGSVFGFRSVRHLEPIVGNRFSQAQGRPAPVGVPIRVALRFHPTDLVVPKGGTIRVTLAGYQTVNTGLESAVFDSPVHIFEQPSWPSLSFTTVDVLHDCDHLSALRFLMPRANPDLLNVREVDEPADEPLADNRPFVAPVSDAGGLATAPVCGQAPIRLDNFGAEIPYDPPS